MALRDLTFTPAAPPSAPEPAVVVDTYAPVEASTVTEAVAVPEAVALADLSDPVRVSAAPLTPADHDVIEALKARIFDLDCNEIRIVAQGPWAPTPYNVFIAVGTRYYDMTSEVRITDEQQMHRIVSHFFLPNTDNGDVDGAQAGLVTKGTFAYAEDDEERVARIQVFYPPVTPELSVNLQLTSKEEMDLEALIDNGTCSLNIAAFLKLATMAGGSILFSGVPGAGKTTLMNACVQEIPNEDPLDPEGYNTSNEPPAFVVAIQEVDEIPMRHLLFKQRFFSFENAARTLGIHRGSSGLGVAGSTSDLVEIMKVARGDRVVIGECRGGEMYDYLETASIFGGAMTTIHAKSAQQAINNAVQFAMRNPNAAVAGLEGVRRLVAGGIDLIVHMEKIDGRRVISEIIELDGSLTDGDIRSSRLFVYNPTLNDWQRPEGSALSEREGRLLSKLNTAGLANLHANPYNG